MLEELQRRNYNPDTVSGHLFRSINKAGIVWGEGLTEKVVWYIVENFAKNVGIEKIAPHDLRRTCARFGHLPGGELEQIQCLLWHLSVQTTERYLSCKQNLTLDRLHFGAGG